MTLPTVLLGLLIPLNPVPVSAAGYGQITGRVVGLDGTPERGAAVRLVRPGGTAAVADTGTDADGRFTVKVPLKGGSADRYSVVIGTGWGATTTLPTWYDGTGADGGIRARVTGTDPFSGDPLVAPAPAGAAVITAGTAPVELGDVLPEQGAYVTWVNRDTKGRILDNVEVIGRWGATGAIEAHSPGPMGPTAEPGRQTFTVVASATEPGGRQQVSLDLQPGERRTVTVTWAARHHLTSLDLAWGWLLDPLAKERPAVGTTLRSEFGFALSAVRYEDLKYQWYRGTKPIRGATSPDYRLRPADRKRKVSLKLRVPAVYGYPAASYRSPKVKVAAVRARVDARFKRRVVTVKVRQSDGARPNGRVELVLDNPAVPFPRVTARLKPNDRGVVRLRIPAGFVQTDDDTSLMYFVRFVSKKRSVSVGVDDGPNAKLKNGPPGF